MKPLVKKSLASISFDLDNKWSYMKTCGKSGWDSYPTYLPTLVPLVLEILRKKGLRITFFIVGMDALQDCNAEVLCSIAEAGHEIANHSLNHEPQLYRYGEKQLGREITEAEKHIKRVTGQRTVGFRGPGYQYNQRILRLLIAQGYEYDASVMPTFIGPLARAYYFMTTNMTTKEKLTHRNLFGSWRTGLYPLHPFYWDIGHGEMIEIPITTMPFVRFPINLSYVLWLSGFF